jgi:predicted CxxxxCH...CXXCH cytochrome family protein
MRSFVVIVVPSLLLLCTAACDSRPAEEGGGGIDPTTGAHTVHLEGTIAEPIACSQCHDARFDVTLPGPLARANGATPSFNPATLTCSNVYCHVGGPGLLLGGGTVPTPVWNPPSVVACGACHAAPGGAVDTASWHPAVASAVQCVLCHPGYTNETVNRAVHVNGEVDLTVADLATNCSACHGDAARVLPPGASSTLKAAPPADRNGNTATTFPGVGAHQAHLLPGPGALSLPIPCQECHVVPADLQHVGPTTATPARLAWGTLARSAGATPGYDGATSTCTNYCHGQTLTAGGGSITRPVWTKVDGTQAACGTCHGSPPLDPAHQIHAAPNVLSLTCVSCHPPGYTIDAVGPDVVPIHVNGVRNVNSTTLPDWNASAPGPNGWTGTSTVGCHGGTRYWTEGVPFQPGCS